MRHCSAFSARYLEAKLLLSLRLHSILAVALIDVAGHAAHAQTDGWGHAGDKREIST